jgi:hypothetical protein
VILFFLTFHTDLFVFCFYFPFIPASPSRDILASTRRQSIGVTVVRASLLRPSEPLTPVTCAMACAGLLHSVPPLPSPPRRRRSQRGHCCPEAAVVPPPPFPRRLLLPTQGLLSGGRCSRRGRCSGCCPAAAVPDAAVAVPTPPLPRCRCCCPDAATDVPTLFPMPPTPPLRTPAARPVPTPTASPPPHHTNCLDVPRFPLSHPFLSCSARTHIARPAACLWVGPGRAAWCWPPSGPGLARPSDSLPLASEGHPSPNDWSHSRVSRLCLVSTLISVPSRGRPYRSRTRPFRFNPSAPFNLPYSLNSVHWSHYPQDFF